MLSAASRASSIHHPDMCFKSLSKQKAVFNFSKLLKTWTNGSAPPKFEIFAFERDTDLLVIQTLKVYLNRSQESRDEKKIAFIRHKYPHKPIPVSDVSRWIKMLLLYQRQIYLCLRVTPHVQHLLLDQCCPGQVFNSWGKQMVQ